MWYVYNERCLKIFEDIHSKKGFTTKEPWKPQTCSVSVFLSRRIFRFYMVLQKDNRKSVEPSEFVGSHGASFVFCRAWCFFRPSRFWPGAAQNAGQTEHPPSKDATKWRNRIEVDFFLKGLRISKSSNQIARAECLFWHLLILLLLCCVVLCVMSLLSYTIFLCILPHSISVYDILFYHSILHDIIWYPTLYWAIILHCIVFNDIVFYCSTLCYIFIIILYNIILYIYSNTLHYYTIHVMIQYIYVYAYTTYILII